MRFIITALALNLFINAAALSQDCERSFEKEIDKFTKESTYRTPGLNNISLIKSVTTKGVTSYYISMTTTGHSATVSGKGAIILLGDGTKISRPQEEVDVEVELGHYHGQGDFEYSAFFRVTPTEIKRISSAGVTDFRLYIYDFTLSESQGEKFKKEASCILAVK